MRGALGLVLALAIGACIPVSFPPGSATPPASESGGSGIGASPSATGASTPSADMTAALLAKPIPLADWFDLVRRMKGRDGTPAKEFEPVRAAAPVESVGATSEFWVYDFQAKRNVRVSAILRVVTASAKFWVQSDVAVDEQALARSAQTFQDRIYPTDRRIFGEEWSPGIDADPRINVIVARIPGAAAGYFSSADEFPRWVNEFSAEREMIYMNVLGTRIGTDSFNSVLAHEFCHMIQFNRRTRTSIWFNEGQAQLCERANGFSLGFETLFLRDPDTQLDAWTELDEGAAQHYGASYLFLEYLRARTGGGYGFINTLMAKAVDTTADIDTALRAAGHPPFEEIFADWVAANVYAGMGLAGLDAKYLYPSDVRLREPAKPTAQDRLAVGGSLRASVHPQAARYVELPRSGQYRVRFDAPAAVRVIPAVPHSGKAYWWSDRADGMDSSLTREVDLTGARAAAISFWAWYDIEKDFDYAYLAVSTDGGKRWTTVPTPEMTSADPNGNNLGTGFTGISGGGKDAVWIEQKADLTPYAGKRILLRFEHVTDGALNKGGFAVDDIEIAEIGYRDDAEADRGWDAKGFIRSTNVVRARYVVQVLHFGATPKVERFVVEDGKVEIDVDAGADRSAPILAVTPLVPRSTEPISFEVQAKARP